MPSHDLALEMDRWVDHFADRLVGLSGLRRPGDVPHDLESLKRLHIAHGQITTMHPRKESEALGNLHQQMILNPQGTRGYGAIAQRGADGRVRLTVVAPDGRSIAWQGVLPDTVPAPRGGTRGSRQQRLEDGVRTAVASATGQTFRPHGVYQRGSDLVPERTSYRTARRRWAVAGPRRRRRRPPRRRRSAFDAFD
jgi:hypothetical protein